MKVKTNRSLSGFPSQSNDVTLSIPSNRVDDFTDIQEHINNAPSGKDIYTHFMHKVTSSVDTDDAKLPESKVIDNKKHILFKLAYVLINTVQEIFEDRDIPEMTQESITQHMEDMARTYGQETAKKLAADIKHVTEKNCL